MPTTDKNGVVQLQTNDLIAPFQTTVNSVSGSISNVLTTLKKDIIYKATNQNNAITKKNALIEQGIVGTPNAPLLFYFTNLNTLYEWDGSSWNQITSEPNTIVVDGVKYQESGRFREQVAMTTAQNACWYGVFNATMPYKPPSGYAFNFNASGTGGYAWVSRITGETSSTPSVYISSHQSSGTRYCCIYWTLQYVG